MKAINKILTSLFVVCLCFGITTSCTEDVPYDPAEMPANAQVYFPNTLPTKVNLSPNFSVTSYNLEVRRIDKTSALTVNLTVVNENPNIFTIPGSVSFGAGSDVAQITITYDPEALGYDVYKPIKITLAQSETSPYGNSVFEFTAGIPGPWKSLGKAIYTDTEFFRDTWEIEIQHHEINPTRYRLVNPFYRKGSPYSNISYNGNEDPYFEFRILPAGSTYTTFNRETGTLTFTTTVDGLVVFEPTALGLTYDDTGAEMVYLHPAARTPTSAGEELWLYNKVTQWSQDGKPEIVQIAPWYAMKPALSGWNYSQNDGVVTILFPGVVLADYSAEIEYTGRFTNTAGVNFAQAEVTLGEDVEYAKVAIVPGVISNEALWGIIDGSIESVEIETSGTVQIPCSKSGTYTYVVITYANDDPKEFDFDLFDFSTGAVSVSISDYYGNFILSGVGIFGQPNANMPVTISAGSEANTLSITGIDFCESIEAKFNPGNGNITIAPLQAFDFVYGDDVYYIEFLTFANGNFSETALLTFSLGSDGKISLTPSSAATGYLVWGENYDDEDDYGWFDGYRNLVFTPSSSSSAPAMKSDAFKVPSIKSNVKDLSKVSIVKESKTSKVSSSKATSTLKKGSVKKALNDQIKLTSAF